MKFSVLQNNFNKALGQVSRIVGARTTLPVLGNILISADKGKIQLSATDLEVAIISYTAGKVDEPGQLTVPARLLTDFIVNNRDQSISFETKKDKENTLILKSEHFQAKIAGISSEEFPTIPEILSENICKIPVADFFSAMKKVAIAPANDETRPVLAGIYYQFEGKSLTLAATDSFRLAEKKLVLEQNFPENKFIVPSRTMVEVLRLMSGAESVADIEIFSSENQVAFKIGETKVISRLIEGAFPNYGQIIPKSSKINAKISHSDLVSAVKMAALFAKNAANNIKISIKGNEITVASISGEVGDASSKISAEVTGGEVEIAFNARYILEALQVMADSKIVFELNDDASAAVMKTEKDDDFIYIVMPLKLDV